MGTNGDEHSGPTETDYFVAQRAGFPGFLDAQAIRAMRQPPELSIASGDGRVVATDVVSKDWWVEEGGELVLASEFRPSPNQDSEPMEYSGRIDLLIGPSALPSRLHVLGFSVLDAVGAPGASPDLEIECHYLEQTECALPVQLEDGRVQIVISSDSSVEIQLIVVQLAWYASPSIGIPMVQATWAIPVA